MEPKLLSIADTGAYLGVSKRTVQRMIKEGKFPIYRINGSIRIPMAGLQKYLEGVRIEASFNTSN